MKKILFSLMLIISMSANAREIIVSAIGEGENYDWAVLNAVENAVRQTNPISIERNGLQKKDITHTLTQEQTAHKNNQIQGSAFLIADGKYDEKANLNAQGDYQQSEENTSNDRKTITSSVKDNSKSIQAQYKGIVSSYEVVEHTQKNNMHQVRINAVILKEDTYDSHDYQSKDLIKKSNYTLAILPFKATTKLNCLCQKVSLNEINNLMTNTFIEKLVPTKKFTLVDRNNFDNYASELSLITDNMTLPENMVKLKNIVPADYILVGTIDHFNAATNKEFIELTGETNYESSSQFKISYRLLETATMEIISVGSVEKKFSKNGAFSSCANVEALLIKRAVAEASEKLLSDIFPDHQPTKPQPAPKKIRKEVPQQKIDYSLPL